MSKVWVLFLLPVSLVAAVHSGSKQTFGVSLRWESPDKESRNHLEKLIVKYENTLRESMDPDCRWRKTVNGVCENQFYRSTLKLELLAEIFKQETLGTFDIHEKNGEVVKKDFDGLSQGYFLEALKLQTHSRAKWMADFAGDIYVSPNYKPSKNVTIGDPLIESVAFAKVEMPGGGWMIAAGGRPMGAELRGDSSKILQKIVLFASPDFNGARLDAWATSVVAGGREILDHLISHKEYHGKWAYFGFDEKSKPFWSKNVKFQIIKGQKIVKVPGWK